VTSKSRWDGLVEEFDLEDVSEDCRRARGGGLGTEGGEEVRWGSGGKSSSGDEGREGPGMGLGGGFSLWGVKERGRGDFEAEEERFEKTGVLSFPLN